MDNAIGERRDDIDDLVVLFPQGDLGTARGAARLASRATGVPQSRITVRRPPCAQVAAECAAGNLKPWDPDTEWSRLVGWTPYLQVRGLDLACGELA